MLSTESFVGARALGEESLQMWDLNKRLEAYLARVKFLEEENEVLRAEIQSAKGSPAGDSWRAKYEEELRALRDALDHAFREKCTAELARDNLYEEVQQVKSRYQKEQAAREEAKKQLSLSRKELEEERRAQIWLKERAVQLEKEVEALLEVHEEEKAGLDQEIASFSQSLESFRCAPVAFQPVEVEDYSKRLSEIWKGAVETYKTEVSQLETSLCQAKENLWKAVEDNQQSQLQLQHLEKDLAGLKARKEMLEESLARQWQEQRGEAEKFQLAMEALEQEKQTLRVQIAQVLEDRQQLMHLKMSLSLEVATYRTLLEAESTRLQMPAGEYKMANGLRDLKLEVSSGGKLAPVSAEARRLLPWDHRASPSVFPRAEGRGQPAKAQSDILTPKSQSPGARELQKISSVLHATALQAAGMAREPGTSGCPVPSPLQPGKAAHPLSPEPASPVPPEPGSPGGEGPAWPGGDGGETSQGKEHPPPGAVAEAHDASIEPPGTAPACSLQYPAQLVSEALEDALKEMQDDAQPKEEPMLSAVWASQDARVSSPVPPIEASGGAVAEGAGERQDPSEGARDSESPEAEERGGEAVLQGLGVETSTLWDRAASPPGLHPCGTASSLSAAASREEMGPWEEEMPTVLSPREPEAVAQEEDASGPGQMGSSWEEPERGEDEAEAPSTEASHPSEDKGERGPHSPCGEDGDFPVKGIDAQGGKSPQREVKAAHAVLVESHPILPMESHLEEDLVDGDQEKFEHQEMPVYETDLAAEEESRQEACPEQEPSSIHEAIPAEEASLGAEEDAVGGEDPGRAKDGEGEKGEAGREALGGEDPRAGEAVGPETLGQESGAREEPGDLQENGFAEEVREQEELEPELEPEPEPGEEAPWGRGDDGSGQKAHPEDWEVTAEDTEGALGTEKPAWADDSPTSAGGLESEETDSTLLAELEETQEDDEDAESQGMSQQQPPLEAEPGPELARDEQEGTAGQPAQAPADVPGQGDSQEPAEAPEEPWEVQDEDADDEISSELGQPESSSTGLMALQQTPGDGAETGESAEEDGGQLGELEQALGTGRSVELEDTLPDSTPLHLYEGETLAMVASSQNPPETEETTETASASEIAPEDEGWLEGRHKPPTPTMPESCEEEAGMEVAPVAEGAEEEEGYFIVSAPNQEVSSSEEPEISEDFEEIKVEATEASKDDLEALGEASLVPEDEGHFEAFIGEADEDMKMPIEEPETLKDEDEDDAGGFTAKLEEGPAVPEADLGSPGDMGLLAGGSDEPAQGSTGSGVREEPGLSEGLAAESDGELNGTVELESNAGRAEMLPGCNLGLVGQEEEEEEDEPSMAHHDAAEPIPQAGLQAHAMPVSPLPDQVEQTSDEQPSMEEEARDGDNLPPAGDKEPPEANPPQLGSAPEQGGFPEMIEESPGAADLSAKVPADIMKDSDILEIVEQALEFNQELVMGVREAEGGQRDPGGTELSRDAGEESSPTLSSEEEPTVQEAPADVAPGMEGPVRAENGLHREASLEDLAKFTEEMLNGITSMPPAQEFPTETADPTAVMPPQPPAPGDATAAKLADATPHSKHSGADTIPVPSTLGDNVLCLTPDQPPACQLRAEQEPWSLADD